MNATDDRNANRDVDPDIDPIRTVLEAAQDSAPPLVAPPFFAVRIRARAAGEVRTTEHSPVAVAAARLLPVFGVVAMLLVGTAVFESATWEREREAAVARAMASNGGGDLLLGAVLLGGGGDVTGGSR